MIAIRQITMREISLPLVEPFRTAAGEVASRRLLLVTLVDVDGISAWSECVAESLPGYAADTVDTCWLAISDWLAPRLLRQAVDRAADAHAMLARNIRGHRMAIAALEMGVWELEASRRGEPLAKLLVDASELSGESVVQPRTQVDTGIALGMKASPGELASHAAAALAEGYRRIKIKIEPGRDLGELHAVREALGPGVPITADANCSYSLDDPAHVRALDTMDGLGLAMIEQPLGYEDLECHARLQRRLRTPICLDESITSSARAEEMLALGSARMLNLKPGRVGGLTEAVAIHDRCARAGVPVWCGGMLESGVGRAYNVALASLPNFTEPGDLSPSARYWERDIVLPAWTMDDAGRVTVPLRRPGIGVDVDVARVDDLTTRVVTLRSP